ncbi:MAG: 4Fe-4S binding protein [Chloroflexi bacterium]|nr:4Fe-4S binding protein [Chloroflexota bacterium]MBU1746871.1 4Fe-4S binding protein [Chloroflexota bacterium]MBU1878908.1 4Fe-4S binding protein [Chloroflexota bacterium]
MLHRFGAWFTRPSTRSFVAEARRTPGYSLFDLLHGYVYAHWPYLYIGVGTGEHRLSRIIGPVVDRASRWLPMPSTDDNSPGELGLAFADSYHGKVVPLAAAAQLVTVNQEICLTDLEQIIPYTQARDIILHDPDHIVALKCPCRAVRPNPCLPLDVCLIVGEPFASFVREHHAGRARQITPAEAVDILRATDERGNVHHAFFKDAMLGRFYAICNCCACCCGAMQAHRMGVPMLAASGYLARVDADACVGCGTCVDYCQFRALSLDGDTAAVDVAACMGCGVCVSKCTLEALSLVREPGKGVPLELGELLDLAQAPTLRHEMLQYQTIHSDT